MNEMFGIHVVYNLIQYLKITFIDEITVRGRNQINLKTLRRLYALENV